MPAENAQIQQTENSTKVHISHISPTMSPDTGTASDSDDGTNSILPDEDRDTNDNQSLSSLLAEYKENQIIENIFENPPSHILPKTSHDTGVTGGSGKDMSPPFQDEGVRRPNLPQ
jgi:hypothetical protein